MVSIAMFNNKGGVGKTTLTCNIASFISDELGKKVLIIDCDPQCNTTQLIMGQDFSANFYWNIDTSNEYTTINDVLQPINDGDSTINKKINVINQNTNRFNVDLLPGSPQLSIIEDRLGTAWQSLLSGDIGGIRKTNWNTYLLRELENSYDYIFYDLGPSLGSINRSVLIGCQYFMTPMGTDIFSILGIKNISEWIGSWITDYENAITLCERKTPDRITEYDIPESLYISKGYVGYTIQQYISKSIKGKKRPTRAYDEIIVDIPRIVEESLRKFASKILQPKDIRLGDVPHLFSLIPLAQSGSSPILKLRGSDGLVGSQFKQQVEYGKLISSIVENLLRNLNSLEKNVVA